MDSRFLALRALGFAAVVLAGCEAPVEEADLLEPLPIRYTTEEVEVATGFDAPLCEGDLRWLDAHTRRLEQLLGVPGDRLRTIYAYDESDILHDAEEGSVFLQIPGCPRNLTGCYHRDERVALGLSHSLAHELVHSVSNDLDPSYVRFWYEGLAEALSEHPLVYQSADLVAEENSDDVRYAIPAHFIRWLMERDGIDAVLQVFEGEPFESVYGMQLAAMERLYDAEAPEVLPSPFACREEAVPPAEDGSFRLALELDCAAAGTTRLRHGNALEHLGVVRTFTTDSASLYVVGAEGVERIEVGGCQTQPGDLFEQLGDVENDTTGLAGFGPPRTTQVHIGQEVLLPARTYRLVLTAPDTDAPKTVRFSMTPVP